MSYHLTSTRMATVQRAENECLQGCGESGTFVPVGGTVGGASTEGSHSGEQYSKSKKQNYHMTQQFHFWVSI